MPRSGSQSNDNPREIDLMRNRAKMILYNKGDNKGDKNEGDFIDMDSSLFRFSQWRWPIRYRLFSRQPFLLFLCSVNGKAIYKDCTRNMKLAGCARPGVGSGKRWAARVERGRSMRDGVAIR